jgi:hypothetical protein
MGEHIFFKLETDQSSIPLKEEEKKKKKKKPFALIHL